MLKFSLGFFNRKKAIIENEIKTKLEHNLSYKKLEKDDGCYYYHSIKTMDDVENQLRKICDTFIEFKNPEL